MSFLNVRNSAIASVVWILVSVTTSVLVNNYVTGNADEERRTSRLANWIGGFGFLGITIAGVLAIWAVHAATNFVDVGKRGLVDIAKFVEVGERGLVDLDGLQRSFASMSKSIARIQRSFEATSDSVTGTAKSLRPSELLASLGI